MGSLPDWLSIGIAVVGLFGGTGAGVYYGAVRRARLEDRREILKVWVPWLKFPFIEPPPGFVRSTSVSKEEQRWELARDAISAFSEVNGLVRLLPWKDRALWQRTMAAFVSQYRYELSGLLDWVKKENLTVGLQLEDFVDWQTKDLDRPDRLYRAMRMSVAKDVLHNELSEIAAAAGGQLRRVFSTEVETSWNDTTRAFSSHLLRQVNPTATSRLADAKMAADLWINGPRPWSKVIRPEAMDLQEQLYLTDTAA